MINGRMAEWLTSAIMLAFAITLAMPGDLVTQSTSFAFFQRFGINEAMLACSMAAVGAARMMALYINGNWRRTPWIRMIGAVCGATLFAFLAVSFFWPYASGLAQVLSIGPSFFVVFTVFDVIAAYRSGFDARAART